MVYENKRCQTIKQLIKDNRSDLRVMTEQNPYQSPQALYSPQLDSEPVHRSFRLTVYPDSPTDKFKIGSLRQALAFASFQQFACLFLMAMVLDGGKLFRLAITASLFFWLSTLFLLVRRKNKPPDQELLCIKWGYFPILLITANVGIIANIVRKITGLL